MVEPVSNLVRKGLRLVRRFFSNKPDDSLQVTDDLLSYVSDGRSGTCKARDVKSIAIEQSFLGLFGTTLNLCTTDGRRVLVKGLEFGIATNLKASADSAHLKSIIADAKQNLDKAANRISEAVSALSENEYLSATQMDRWAETYFDLRFLIVLGESTIMNAGADNSALECRKALKNPDAWRASRNDAWIKKALEAFEEEFASLGKDPLTRRQKEAVLRNDNRVLAVAGAGTGKTTTVLAKVRFLLATKWCKPQDILLLSFSRGTVEELKARVADECGDALQIRTFHSLGLEIIGEATGRKPAISDQGGSRGQPGPVTAILEQLLEDSKSYRDVLEFMAYHYYPSKHQRDFETKAAYLQYLSSNDIRTLKDETVKSNQEAQIANWLYLNGIPYIYESEFKEEQTGNRKKRLYQPDFWLPESGIYIEHFGIDRDGSTASYINRTEYHASMKWKRQLHSKHKTRLVQTYSYQEREGTLIDDLKAQLSAFGVSPRPVPQVDLLASEKIRQRLLPMAKLLSTGLTLFKGERAPLADLEERMKRVPGKRRAAAYMKVFKMVYREYQALLDRKGEVDFGDMIIEAATLVEDGGYRSPFKVIIVDEFQDISPGRAWLMNTLLEQVPDARLLCVGDDWQSIYRFTGSDVSLMTRYETQWPQAVRIDLDRTFRFSDQLQTVSSKFITENPLQLQKEISCDTQKNGPAVHIVTTDIDELVTRVRAKSPNSSILVLGRYNHTVPKELEGNLGSPENSTRCMTVHKSKGSEADYVIVNSMESGRYGFPTTMVDDPLISVFLSDPEGFANAEERRLFYVALTRARHDVWLLVRPDRPSEFIQELIRDDKYKGLVTSEPGAIVLGRECPECGGTVVIRQNKRDHSSFLGCVFYPRCNGTVPGCPECKKAIPVRKKGRLECPSQVCDWGARVCPECKDGYAIERNGKYGRFFGCSKFAAGSCSWTENIRN